MKNYLLSIAVIMTSGSLFASDKMPDKAQSFESLEFRFYQAWNVAERNWNHQESGDQVTIFKEVLAAAQQYEAAGGTLAETFKKLRKERYEPRVWLSEIAGQAKPAEQAEEKKS